MGQLIAGVIAWSTGMIASVGYAGVALLIALEVVFPPIPSEVVLPLAGSLSAAGRFNFVLVILAATVGSLMGAALLYALGRWGGERRIGGWLDRYGKWLLLSRDDLYKTRDWFARHGNYAVLVARLVPGMRSYVSVPAGLAAMPFGRFLAFSAIGSGIWNSILVLAGYYLGSNWASVEGWIAPLGPIVYLFIFGLLAVFVVRRLRDKLRPAAPPSDGREG